MRLILGSMLIMLVSACRATSQPMSEATVFRQPLTTAAASPHVQIATHVATARVQTGKVMPVSVSCRPGEQLLGGGFSSSNLFEYAAAIEASYPSSATTWTVTAAAPSSYFTVEVQAYCLPATLPLGIQIVRASGTTVGRIACPQGTVLLSGGARSSAPIGVDVSYPLGNGWMSAPVNASSLQVYALCAAHHVVRGQLVTSVFNAHSSSHSYAPEGGSVTCPAGQVTTGGGFEGQDLIVGSAATSSAFAGWSVAAGGDADVTITAVCWVPQG